MSGDTRSLLHGIFNLLLPFFIYDLASLLVAAFTAARYNPWISFLPMSILLLLPTCPTPSAWWWQPCVSTAVGAPVRCWG